MLLGGGGGTRATQSQAAPQPGLTDGTQVRGSCPRFTDCSHRGAKSQCEKIRGPTQGLLPALLTHTLKGPRVIHHLFFLTPRARAEAHTLAGVSAVKSRVCLDSLRGDSTHFPVAPCPSLRSGSLPFPAAGSLLGGGGDLPSPHTLRWWGAGHV